MTRGARACLYKKIPVPIRKIYHAGAATHTSSMSPMAHTTTAEVATVQKEQPRWLLRRSHCSCIAREDSAGRNVWYTLPDPFTCFGRGARAVAAVEAEVASRGGRLRIPEDT